MATDADDLRDIFVDVTGEESLTERQEEAVSHDPVEESVEISADDGLDEAIDTDFDDAGGVAG